MKERRQDQSYDRLERFRVKAFVDECGNGRSSLSIVDKINKTR
jgi:hypothetical protein